jgi:tetraspanin-13/31
MCSGFTCSKNTLVGLNIVYILVSFLLIGVAVHGKVSGVVTSLPIIGGITACGIFLLLISIIGLIGAMRHNQVTLFVYMIVLFCIFVIQFSVSCAALGVNNEDEKVILEKAWSKADNETIFDAEKLFDCCGLSNISEGVGCDQLTCAAGAKGVESCAPCMVKLQEKINSAFNAAGGLGLFFSFTELIGGIVACRYRNLMDPFASGPAGAPFAGSM